VFQEDLIEENLLQELLKMKNNASNSTPGSNTNGTPAQLVNGVHRVNGNSKRKYHAVLQTDSRPTKKQSVYMDVSDEEDKGISPKVDRTLANGISTSPLDAKHLRKKKSKGNIGHSVDGNAKHLALQEQRKQLPIARGTCKFSTSNMHDTQDHILRERSSH
jgi:hypothetical protein